MCKEEREIILRYLFEGYIESGGIYRIRLNSLIDELGNDAINKLKSLETEGVIKYLETLKGGTTALLTYKGAFEANPSYFVEQGDKAISALMQEGGSCHILWAFSVSPDEAGLAHDLVEYLENMGLAEFDKRKDKRTLHISNRGRECYDENKARFL